MSTLGDRAAFPRTGSYSGDVNISSQEGMSLRAWLAGQALAGLCTSTGLYDARTPEAEAKNAVIINQVAQAVVAIADATLKELAKEGR